MVGEGFALDAIRAIKNNRNLRQKNHPFSKRESLLKNTKIRTRKQRKLTNAERLKIRTELQAEQQKDTKRTILIFGISAIVLAVLVALYLF